MAWRVLLPPHLAPQLCLRIFRLPLRSRQLLTQRRKLGGAGRCHVLPRLLLVPVRCQLRLSGLPACRRGLASCNSCVGSSRCSALLQRCIGAPQGRHLQPQRLAGCLCQQCVCIEARRRCRCLSHRRRRRRQHRQEGGRSLKLLLALALVSSNAWNVCGDVNERPAREGETHAGARL